MVAIFEIEIEIEIEIGKKCLLDAKSLRTDILLKDNFPQKVVQPFGIGVVIGVEFAEPPGDRLPVCGSKQNPRGRPSRKPTIGGATSTREAD